MLRRVSSFILILLVFTVSANANQTEPFKQDGFFPLLQEQSYAKGVKAPKGFFVSPFYNYIDEGMDISKISATLPIIPFPVSGINLNDVNVEVHNIGVRAGIWLFPFLNFYAMYTHSEGTVNFKIDATGALGQLTMLPADIQGTILPMVGMLSTLDGTDFAADTFAVGATAAYGVQKAFFGLDVFGNMDLNISTSQVDILDTSVEVIVFSPRLGLAKDFSNGMSFAAWFGGMYRDNLDYGKSVSGTYDVPVIGGIGFNASQRVLDPWNMLVGVRFVPCDYFYILAEYGFLNKTTFNLSASFNF